MDDDFKIFFDEVNDLVQSLERELISLEKTPKDKSLIQDIFRILHTIKGNAAMFGYYEMAEFAHYLETIFNLVRNDKLSVTKKIINCCIESVDVFQSILINKGTIHDNIKNKETKIKNEFEHILKSNQSTDKRNKLEQKESPTEKKIKKDEDSMSELHKQAFIEEATELISELEKSLLELEKNEDDKELISKVFRAMHTIKGSAAMFGFDDISVFTHDIETVYDLIRNGIIKVNKEVIDITLQAVDQINSMLKNDFDSENDDKVKNILSAFRNILNKHKTDELSTNEILKTNKKGSIEKQDKVYCIIVSPDEDIMQNGTNVLGLIKELKELGLSCVKACMNKSITLENIDYEKCYTKWIVLLKTEKEIDAIKDVFMFVEDECKLNIKESKNAFLLENDEQFYLFCEHFEKTTFDINFDLEKEFERFSSGYLNEVQKDVKTNKVEKTSKSVETDKVSSLRVSAEKLDELVNLVGELVTVQARLTSVANNFNDPSLLNISEEVERITWSLRDSALNIRMLPIGTLFNKFNRLIRDLSKELNKEVELIIEGAETELDKTVIEKLNDPLIHLLRNSIDHGIEPPEQRKALNKPLQGVIHLSATQSGGDVLIRISDDGAGLNKEEIKKKAISQGLINENAELSDQEIFSLIFQPGFSTAKKVTNVSGRGVGMDVVKKAIELLRGSIEISSKQNIGTTITLKLPLTLAIIDGLLVDISGSNFILPLSVVEECVELSEKDIENTHGRNYINIRDEIIPYVNLRERFEIEGQKPEIEQVVIVLVNNIKCGFVVDKVVGQHQTVLKTLGKVYKNVEGISGATILGDGTVALILDIAKLVEQEIDIAKETY